MYNHKKTPKKKKARILHPTEIFQINEYNNLLKAIAFEGPEYVYSDLMKPKNEFYKFLAKRPKKSSSMHERKLHLWIPDTIVYNDGSN